jgi:predicted GNAT superfamily acetyltransferase
MMSGSGPPVQMRLLRTPEELGVVDVVFTQTWGSAGKMPIELLIAIAHSGGYVAAAYQDDTVVGASIGLLARHLDRPALHSHVTAVVPTLRHGGIGRLIKTHQRTWAIARGLEWITWTFDPLVRRNAWFNLALLGAEAHAYLPSFYGTMTDAINAGDESDRLQVAWDLSREIPATPRDGHDALGSSVDELTLIPTPADIVELRRVDPLAVAVWRRDTRDALTTTLDRGRRIVGFTRDGNYVIGPHP